MSSEAQNVIAEVLREHQFEWGVDGTRCIGSPCKWRGGYYSRHADHVAEEIDKALGGLTREEQWVPVEESGHRWLGRSEDEAAWALENYSKDGDSHDPDMDSPLTHIAHEARWVSGWSEA
ncbi:hypothetical protein SEA_AUBS_84 [Mycobacterium phage Aubs]|uniref:Uncharacterized protein n=1 Tax=Mycobacterium phage Donkeykong TaxID=2656572 RepID=A0A649VFN3_9CAUD|nr:hypothetical protein I5H28_gp090 [Mycobacterium phage Donkeykong]QGJ90875.1 hypothetical protein SEA_DONKEYKONG_90 [Mycobacterium phage Donkeykong]UXE04556.1 hypothetical protein SEA_AUBS_84 [Mycobacterium phage Aubs]